MKFLLSILIFCISFNLFAFTIPTPFIPDLITAVKVRQMNSSNRKYLLLKDIAKNAGMSVSINGSKISMVNKSARFTFTHHKRYAAYNGNEISLLFAPSISGSNVWISQADYQWVLLPLLASKSMIQHAVKTVCIDPGHGGDDPGCKRGKVYEKNINLAVALRLRSKLRAMGYRVVMTRETDRFIPLAQRCAIANKAGAQIFVSIHCNSVKNSAISGVESFAMTPPNTPSTSDVTGSRTRYPGNAYDRNNYRLTFELQRGVKAAMKSGDRGVRHARFAVLRDIKCPGTLVELGFLSNYSDAKKMVDPKYQDSIATQLAQGVLRYHKALKR